MDIQINLNAQNLNSAFREYIAVTVLHEALHAYFRYENKTFDHDVMVYEYIPWFSSTMHAMFPTMDTGDITALAYRGYLTALHFFIVLLIKIKSCMPLLIHLINVEEKEHHVPGK